MPPTPPGQDFQYTLNCRGPARRPDEFDDVIVKTGADGAVTRMRDIGRVELGAQPTARPLRSTASRRPAWHLSVARRQRADVSDASRPRWRSWRAASRRASPIRLPFDTTKFVNASVHEVYKTLIEAGVLVLVVILVFLQDWRAMLVPATTVPVTIIGAFATMAALGFTVNLSTLFAIVLAIGIVVDDAIVVVEGAAHNIERHERPRRGDQGHERAVRADHRHHAGADVGVHPGGIPARPDRPDVRAVRPGHRRDRTDQRDQRRRR